MERHGLHLNSNHLASLGLLGFLGSVSVSGAADLLNR